jgi:hypothetical protein
VPDGGHDLGGLLGVRIVAGAVDDLHARLGDAGRQLALTLGREHEVIPPGQHQRRHGDLAEAVHDRPAVEQVAAGEDERLRPVPGAPPAFDRSPCSQPQGGLVGVGARNPHGHGDVLMGGELAGEPAPDQFHLLGAVAAAGEHVRGVLPSPVSVAAGVEQHQVRQAGRVA